MELYVNLYFLGIQKDTHLFDGALNKQTFDLLHFLDLAVRSVEGGDS